MDRDRRPQTILSSGPAQGLREDLHFGYASNSGETCRAVLRHLEIKIAGVAYEAGPTGFSLARALQTENIPVIVAAPSKIPRSISADAKTDPLNCLKLVQFVSKGLLRPIAVPTAQQEAERAQCLRCHQLVDSIRRCKQRIKDFLLYHGFKETESLRRWHMDNSNQIAAMPLKAEGRSTVESYLRELTFLEIELRSVIELLEHMNQHPRHRPVIKSLTSVPDMGKIVATTFHTERFRPETF